MMSSSLPLVLIFAASDPTSGAGIQADLLTVAGLGCHGLTALTALTVQDTSGVWSVHPVAADLVRRQARAVLDDMPVAAFKLGVLGSAQNARVVARIAAAYPHIPLVFDPVLASGRGDPLAGEALVEVLRQKLLPRATVLTPNAPEARRLAGMADDAPLAGCARRLMDLGAQHVLVTGAHDETPDVVNTLYGPGGVLRADRWPRLPGSYHGSGCTLASALAARLAAGVPLESAVAQAQAYTWQSLASGFRPGKGQSIPRRFFSTNHGQADDGTP